MRNPKKRGDDSRPPDGTPRPRNPDDPQLASFLGSREDSEPLDEATIRTMAVNMRKRAKVGDALVAALHNEDGEDVIALYMRRADEVLGFPTFEAFLLEWWPLTLKTAYERADVAKFCTRAQLGLYCYTKCREATRLGRAMALKSLEELEKVDLKLPKKAGGGTIRVADATPEQLAAVNNLLGAPVQEGGRKTPGQALYETRAWVREKEEADPQIAALGVSCSLKDGRVAVRVPGGVGPEQAAAAARFFRAYARYVAS